MVASRCAQRLNLRAAACNRSTSAAVRYSRVLTEEFTMVGASLSTSDISAVLALTVGVRGEIDPATAAASPDRLTEIRRYRGRAGSDDIKDDRSEEHTSELQS